MARRSSRRKLGGLERDVRVFTTAGVTLGVGGAVVGAAGGNTAGFAAAGSLLPAVGTVVLGKHVIKNVELLKPKTRKRRKK